eukprot:m.706618 g.706618  ORF g.706618 m.706618 type:complete len:113 (-) comp22934_c0_seq7:436-774(-)
MTCFRNAESLTNTTRVWCNIDSLQYKRVKTKVHRSSGIAAAHVATTMPHSAVNSNIVSVCSPSTPPKAITDGNVENCVAMSSALIDFIASFSVSCGATRVKYEVTGSTPLRP